MLSVMMLKHKLSNTKRGVSMSCLGITKEIEGLIIKDREIGFSYPALVDKYSKYGLTVKIARRITKGIKKGEVGVSVSPINKETANHQLAVDAILPLAVRHVGVKPSEYRHILRDVYGTFRDEDGSIKLNMTKRQRSYLIKRVKDEANKKGLTACFVPEWMDVNKPEQCNRMMLSIANDLYEYVEEKIEEFIGCYPDLDNTAGWSIRNEMFSLVVQGYSPEGVATRCERNAEVVCFLKGEEYL